MDGFFGDSGRKNAPKYNVHAVTNSLVNNAAVSLGLGTNAGAIYKLRTELTTTNCRYRNPTVCRQICLFNLEDDPCETTDISLFHPMKVLNLRVKLFNYRKVLVPQQTKPVDPLANPKFCNGTFYNWLDIDGCYSQQLNI